MTGLHGKLAVAGTFASVAIAVCVNVLGARHFRRWDATSSGAYTLSPVTLETLANLREPVEVVVFLSQTDPLTPSVETMVDAYRANTPWLRPRFLDPDRHPAEFIALQREYGMLEGRTEDGRLVADASIVLVSGGRHWFVTTDAMVAYDEREGRMQPRLEQALTEGLVNVLGRKPSKVCFTAGQGELDVDAVGPRGLPELRSRLTRSNAAVRSVDLNSPSPNQRLLECDLVVVARPESPFTPSAAERLVAHVKGGRDLLLALNPVSDDDGRIVDPRLSTVLDLARVSAARNVVLERDDSLTPAAGVGGEVFLATPDTHPITRGLIDRGQARWRVKLRLAQELILADPGTARPLLHASERSLARSNFREVTEPGEPADPNLAEGRPQGRVVAAAAELGEWRAADQQRGVRMVVLGTASVLEDATWTDPSQLGARRFVESIFTWLLARPALVSVPEKATRPAGLNLTEESLTEVRRYVLLYMPLAVVVMGVLIALMRRERTPRRKGPEQHAP